MKKLSLFTLGLVSLVSLEGSLSAKEFGVINNADFAKKVSFMKAGTAKLFADSELGKSNRRCEQDSLSASQAKGRFEWLKKCEPNAMVRWFDRAYNIPGLSTQTKLKYLEEDLFYFRGSKLAKPFYFTFADSNLDNPYDYYAPVDGSAACNGIPQGYSLIFTTCRSSCYHPSQRLDFNGQEVAIKSAFEEKFDKITTLSDSANLDSLEYTTRDIDQYTISLSDTDHKLLRILTKSGGSLLVTPNHPLVISKGEMVEASDLVAGQSELIKQDGAADMVSSIVEVDYFGKVYNVKTKSESLNGQILIAEGYLSGSDWYQNEGFAHVSRMVLRSAIDEL